MDYAKFILKNKIDLTLSVSNRVKELLTDFGADNEKIKVINQIPPGIEYLKDRFQKRFEIHSPIRFGFIGTAIPQKGVHTIVAAASLIPGNNAEFHIYGFGVPAYLNELKKFDKNNKIIWHGEYKFEEFPDIANNIDVIIIPSIWEDCAPLVVVEALAMGLPVIGANIGGIPDFINNGINGLLFQSGNHIELANILIDLINNPQKLINMRKRTNVNLTFSDFMNKIMEIYNTDLDKVEDWKFKEL
jgi:glycosyltransferase involved in cell wall biosynthesis